MGLGLLLVKVFKLPHWVTPAIAFNNTTSLPLLLVQSLSATGILSSLLTSPNDSMSDAIERAKSYFLVNAMIGNSLTFAIGPALLNGHEEDAPDTSEDKHDSTGQNGRATDGANDVEQARDRDHREEEEENERSHERAPLLVNYVIRASDHAARVASRRQSEFYESLPPWVQKALSFSYQFLNAPVIGAVIGAVIGLTPPLHRVFFNSTENGGYLNAWLTTSIKNIGDLFAALQVIVVGVKLSQSMVKMKRGEESGSAPWLPMVIITFVRLVLWPAISIPLIYALATKTQTLDKDPILWFAMMLMPVGPPALKLAALADVNGSGEKEKMSIAKFLTISYVLSPLICFAIVGSLSASEAATAKM
ncbi:MAG: hypothetical protein M1822_007863 [Bathelium mastoideum]|nr:MAG: hypothetical protein M1822_007863 [Bathelium mastoideum]